LTGAGLVCGLSIRESRGARTFLALVVASVPVHFAVLGGLLQSQFPLDSTLTGNAPWNVDSPVTAVWLAGLGVMTLIPLTWLSMLTLVRPHARRLTLTFIAVNMALLLPVRDPGSVAWLVALMSILAFTVEPRADCHHRRPHHALVRPRDALRRADAPDGRRALLRMDTEGAQ
jgi:hypothetical protein